MKTKMKRLMKNKKKIIMKRINKQKMVSSMRKKNMKKNIMKKTNQIIIKVMILQFKRKFLQE